MKIKFEYKEFNEKVEYIINKFKNNNILESSNPDLIISIGGDGSLLHSIYKNPNVNNFILINIGALGFYESFNINNIDLLIEGLLNNKLVFNNINLLKLNIFTMENNYSINAINDFMIRSVNYKSCYLDLFVKNKKVESVIGDGILISSAYGSTAYNLSLNGPIFTDDNLISITPVNSIHNANLKGINNSLLLNKDMDIEIKPFNKTKDIIVLADGKPFKITDFKSCKLSLNSREIKLLSSNKIDFIDKIINKIM